MATKPSQPHDDLGPLADLLEPHLDGLSAAARERERLATELAEHQRAERARLDRRRLDEAELMALIFAHLDPDNPRVYAGVEFDRLIVLSEPEPLAPEPRAPEPRAPEPRAIDPSPSPNTSDTAEPEREPPTSAAIDTSAWVGREWVDDIRPIPSAVLDRPELEPRQRELLARASRRELACLNLRRLTRDYALAHLELFVHACRAERVRFCRVIPGKGVSSRAEPVLKRAVIEWCRGSGIDRVIGWAPELDTHGEWGAMVLELRSLA